MIRILLIIAGFFLSLLSFGQDSTAIGNDVDGKYIKIESGINTIKFRDLATSPLYYEGSLKFFELGWVKMHNEKERELIFSYSHGKATNNTEKQSTSSTISIYSLNYAKFYPLWRNEKWLIKVGGEFRNSFHVRNNVALRNNQQGLEAFSTLLASGKILRDISNKKGKRLKFLFIPINIKARKRDLALHVNMAVMNNTYRNGYAYNDNSSITNNLMLFADYQLKAFSGYRIGTELNYTMFFKNNNALQLGYKFDGYKTGGTLDKFAMVNHKIKVALFFKIK